MSVSSLSPPPDDISISSHSTSISTPKPPVPLLAARAATPSVTDLPSLRQSWKYAAINQFVFMFWDALKVPEYEPEELELALLAEEDAVDGLCMKLRLTLVKAISSNRGITESNVDEFVNRQWERRRPHQPSPYRPPPTEDEKETGAEPATELRTWMELSLDEKLDVLWRLCEFQMDNPERFRERMGAGMSEQEQLGWRIDPIGFDYLGWSYYLLDDNRLYRRYEHVPDDEEKAPKKKTPARATRKRKRGAVVEEAEEEKEPKEKIEYGKWECICTTIDEWQSFTDSLAPSLSDPNTSALHTHLTTNVLPQLHLDAEARAREAAAKLKEQQKFEALNTRKRSSRLEAREAEERERMEKEREERRRRELVEEAERKTRGVKDGGERRMTREERLREREMRALGIEMSKQNTPATSEPPKSSPKKEPEQEKEETWLFDCPPCGTYGYNLDDGEMQICCERCDRWSHIKCVSDVKEREELIKRNDEGTLEGVVFVCERCKAKEGGQVKEEMKATPTPTPTPMPGPGPSAYNPYNPSPTPAQQAQQRPPVMAPQQQPMMVNPNTNATPYAAAAGMRGPPLGTFGGPAMPMVQQQQQQHAQQQLQTQPPQRKGQYPPEMAYPQQQCQIPVQGQWPPPATQPQPRAHTPGTPVQQGQGQWAQGVPQQPQQQRWQSPGAMQSGWRVPVGIAAQPQAQAQGMTQQGYTLQGQFGGLVPVQGQRVNGGYPQQGQVVRGGHPVYGSAQGQVNGVYGGVPLPQQQQGYYPPPQGRGQQYQGGYPPQQR
ncbi:hypothetical protein G7K_0908-t1 [Saitoella complicata NRRL Y-17804]|uniref:Zinc finger PHD-type domain-containing protein n=2 Tax=Saitoella complicata (strain BCRC 22490 / CBS 7301 / JCM 7358 / NBRC 10748 / NRRL Y-17804) TaxID=698492 RepID=A0A0E9NA28_SAICN|nr:hypothetical protein G7K_0908-t1 [Saitoella complicata NRRL Y-17804]